MRIPANASAKVYKCVKCGGLVQTGHGTPPPGELASTKTPPPEPQSMADLFVEMGLVTREQMDEAKKQQKENEKIFETLLRLEMTTPEDLHAHLSREPGAAAINLAHFNIDRDLTALLPLEAVRQHWALPISALGRSLTIAMVCPIDMEAVKAIEGLTQKRIRPMLCTVADFKAAVRKHYRVPDLTTPEPDTDAPRDETAPTPPTSATEVDAPDGEQLRTALAALERLPLPARVMNQVDAVVGDEHEGIRQVVSVVGASPALTANVLATANTSAYGLPKQVDSIPLAITLLGDQAVSLLAANAPKVSMGEEKQWAPLTRISRHCAEIAALLALSSGRATPNSAYCAGLLHAIGSYALGALDPEEYTKIDPDTPPDTRRKAETQVFGLGFPEAGALLATQWRFPEPLTETIRHSADPEQAGDFRDLAMIVHLAVRLARADGQVEQEAITDCADALKSLNIDLAEITETLTQTAATTANAQS